MTNEQLIPLNIVIGDRSYRIKISPSDEEMVRKTLKAINEKIIEFKTQFAGKDMQDYISMVFVWYATQPKENIQENISSHLIDSLLKMEKQLDDVI
ncbi:MAG: cell division protein ZapA [Ginsengibacter sp.]